MHVLIIGPSIDRTKGGMATVIDAQIKSVHQFPGLKYEHVVSHVEANFIVKFWYLLKSVYQLLFKRYYEIVHIHVASDASFYRKSILMLIAKAKGIPVILHVHGSDFDQFYLQSNRLLRIFIRYVFSVTDKVIVLSNYWYGFFKDHMPKADVFTLYNGVDISVFSHFKPADSSLNHFLFLGRLGQRKGIYDLIKAIQLIVKEKGIDDIKFFIAGDGEIEEVKALITKSGLEDNVIILGWLNDDEKMHWFNEVSTVVLPSYSEGLPMALIEAMAAGKVIISTDVGGIPELVDEGENGFLIKPGDIDGLVKSIIHVIESKSAVQIISKSNAEKIRIKYNLYENNVQLQAIYKQLVLRK